MSADTRKFRRALRCDQAACRSLLAQGSRSFALAARLLPGPVQRDATALYAFCRTADDAIDRSDSPVQALGRLRSRLDALYQAKPHDHAVDRALADVVQRHYLPRALPEALLEGLAWDVTDREYRTLSDLEAYAARVAASVGAMMTVIMGRCDRDTLARACELGLAMQLTNIARDLGEDAAIGRCYVPVEWRVTAAGRPLGDDPRRWPVDDRRRIVKRLLDAAAGHYRRAEPGIAALPYRCRFGVRAAARIYGEIGQAIAALGYDSLAGRATVSPARKARLLVGARSAHVSADTGSEPLATPETGFLIDAVAGRGLPSAGPSIRVESLRWWQLGAQWAWVVELFERLALRERLDRDEPATSNDVSRSTATQQR